MQSTELSSDDRLSIMDLLARYAHCVDSGDLDGYVSLFTDDAVLFGEHRGRDTIRAYVASVIERTLPRGDLWRYEPKLDGFRGLLWRAPSGSVHLVS